MHIAKKRSAFAALRFILENMLDYFAAGAFIVFTTTT